MTEAVVVAVFAEAVVVAAMVKAVVELMVPAALAETFAAEASHWWKWWKYNWWCCQR